MNSMCRGCGNRSIELVYDFGDQPLAGDFPESPESASPVSRYRLDLSQCTRCGLLQVVNVPPIHEVFHSDYRYSSSTVPGLVRHFAEYADWLIEQLPEQGSVFEFGCNDGVLLDELKKRGISCVGIDASDNMANLARRKGHEVHTGFLTKEFVKELAISNSFDLVTCSNVFAHIDDLGSTIDAVRELLVPGGLFSVEVHDGDLLISQRQFDTIYHEHLTYFTSETLSDLLARYGFEEVTTVKTPMHGGGLRMVVRYTGRESASFRPGGSVVRDFISSELTRCEEDLRSLYEEHGSLYGYGAAGRSQMFLNFTKATEYFSCVFDDSPFRQGRYIAGSDLPIQAYNGEEGDCLVILAWNYAGDISDRVSSKFKRIVTLLPSMTDWK